MTPDEHRDLLARLRRDARRLPPTPEGLADRVRARLPPAVAGLPTILSRLQHIPTWRPALAAGLLAACAGGLWLVGDRGGPPIGPATPVTVAIPTAAAPDVGAMLALVDRPWRQELARLDDDRQRLGAWADQALGGTMRAILDLAGP